MVVRITTATILALILATWALSGKIEEVYVLANKPQANIEKLTYTDLNYKSRKEVECLARNMYFEAGIEPIEGQLAVAKVTLNRTRSKSFPDTVCEVVHQKVRSTCQFSWVCEKPKVMPEAKRAEFRELATNVYISFKMGYNTQKNLNDALFYHADYVHPGWQNLKPITKIGHHIFYRM